MPQSNESLGDAAVVVLDALERLLELDLALLAVDLAQLLKVERVQALLDREPKRGRLRLVAWVERDRKSVV